MKYFAIDKYYKKLYGHLKKRYGALESFTHGQIKRTIEECKFSKKYISYAYALFLGKEELSFILSQEYPEITADEVRRYIAKRYFDGNENYTYKESVLSKVGNYGTDSIGTTPDGGGVVGIKSHITLRY
jgi:hypothetical protein